MFDRHLRVSHVFSDRLPRRRNIYIQKVSSLVCMPDKMFGVVCSDLLVIGFRTSSDSPLLHSPAPSIISYNIRSNKLRTMYVYRYTVRAERAKDSLQHATLPLI